MADDHQTRADTPPAAKAAPRDATVSRERLIAESDAWVGQPPHVMAGALAGVRGKSDLTVNEAKAAVKAFLAGEVK